MTSPFEILLDARLALCNDPEWSSEIYPNAFHLAHIVLERAGLHLGIRALEGYSGTRSTTAYLYERLDTEVMPPADSPLQFWSAA